jgi:hypothetical protein
MGRRELSGKEKPKRKVKLFFVEPDDGIIRYVKRKAFTVGTFRLRGRPVVNIGLSSVHIFSPDECEDLADTLLEAAKQMRAFGDHTHKKSKRA